MKPFSIAESPGIGASAPQRGAHIVPDGGVVMLPHIHVVGVCPEGWTDPHETAGPGPHGVLCVRGGQRLTVE